MAKLILVIGVPSEVGRYYEAFIKSLRQIIPGITHTTFLPTGSMVEINTVDEKGGTCKEHIA